MSAFSTLLIPIIESLMLNEIGEANITPLKWKQISNYQYKFPVNIGDKEEVVNVDFENIESEDARYFYFPPKYRNLEDVYNIGYNISGVDIQFAKTDLKTLLTVLSTVVDIVKHFIQNNPSIDGLFIKGTAKELGSKDISKKTNLYKAYIKKQLDQVPGFGVDTYRQGFIITKTK